MTKNNQQTFIKRLFIYQNERFPILGHGTLILVFTFSAISYSRICRSATGFIPWEDFFIGVFVTIALFFLLRIFDEFKDQKDDAKYRAYLPVPRGLISLNELKIVGFITFSLQLLLITVFQYQMLGLFVIVILYLLLMGREFFIPEWLRQRQMMYNLSHMFIIPLIDLYASGLDWLLGGHLPHWGLAWFFATSYTNGMVLEFGRKIRSPNNEEEGVRTYTSIYGTKKAVVIWIFFVFTTMLLALGTAWYANLGYLSFIIFILLFSICVSPAISFYKKPTVKNSKYIEHFSAVWTIFMYLTIGAIPMLNSFI